MVSDSKVYSKQQDTFSNQSVSIYNKLWLRIEDGSEYQKKGKSRKNDGVHRKNEEGTEGSRSSIKKDVGENEETSVITQRSQIRKLDRELCTGSSTLYTLDQWSMLHYYQPILNNHLYNMLYNVILSRACYYFLS